VTTEVRRGTALDRPTPAGVTGTYVPPTARRTRRRRRPSGAPPPLPRQIGWTGKGWLVAVAVLVGWLIVTAVSEWARRVTDQIDAAILRGFARLRTEWLTDVMRAVDRAATGWWMFGIAAALVVLMVVFRRWRHLFTFLGSVMVLEVIGLTMIDAYSRPRPYDVTAIGRWRGFSLPSATAAVVTFTIVGAIYTMTVPGRPRQIAKVIGLTAGGVVVFARLYLGVDHPFDVLVGAALFAAILINAFRFFTPNEVFPITYHAGKSAHLDVGGRRGEAIRQAVEEQLGVTVVDIKPVGLAGSGGSTPLRLRVAGDPDTYLFGKLYAMNHVRADRWYKLGRTILYGRLEDEAPFQSVRRLVQYEDYTLRLMRDAGLPSAQPMGIVELTPEREYLIVNEFFDGAKEIGDADVDDQVIDEGLSLVRRLWQAGLAHRDIKPANLMVRDGHVMLIDVAFAQVRPSPWRQAIDLANMMLVLAVRTDAERVYQRALTYFTPDEIAEAFAAARGVASPTQLRTVMKQDGRDLLAQFRALAPARRPISLQRWGPKRVILAVGLALAALFVLTTVYSMFTPADLPVSAEPSCGTDDVMILMAQAVPTAVAVPCIAAVPAGWDVGGVQVKRDRGRFRLETSGNMVEVTLQPPAACVVDAATQVPSDEIGMRRFELPEQLPPGLRTTRTYLYEGGCVTYRMEFAEDSGGASLIHDVNAALAFQPRADIVREVDERSGGLSLCGADAPPCVGEE
jgi:tRNA A-37 threonylcarbamoyl transferase component Bud32/membrane-associated phospholipid phosphatase